MKNSTPFSYLPPFTGRSWITLTPDLCSPTYGKLAKSPKGQLQGIHSAFTSPDPICYGPPVATLTFGNSPPYS